MINVVYVTGNPEKAANFSKHIGINIAHRSVELDEIQTLDAAELVEHKARQAYATLALPVLVEDVTLEFDALGGLPGPFVKYFVHANSDNESGVERMCRMLDGFDNRRATARCTFGIYDGTRLMLFDGSVAGSIAIRPMGDGGFGFDRIFIPDEANGKTAAQFTVAEYEQYYTTIKPFARVREFLTGDQS